MTIEITPEIALLILVVGVAVGVKIGRYLRDKDPLALPGGGVHYPDFAFIQIPNWMLHENERMKVQKQNVKAQWLHWAASLVGGGRNV